MIKKGLIGVGVLLLLFVALVLALFHDALLGMKAMVDDTPVGTAGAVQISDGYVSLYLLPGDPGEVALVDAGNDPTGKAVLAALKKKGYSPESVKAIFLTHGHPDHVAGAHLFPKAEVFAFPADVKLASGEERPKGPLTSRLDFPKEKAATVTKTLTDGQTVGLGALQVRAFAVPGHTGGSAAFVSGGVLFLGDNCSGKSDGKSIGAAPKMFTDDPVQNKASLKALHARLKAENVDVKTLAFGHTGPLDGVDLLLTAGD